MTITKWIFDICLVVWTVQGIAGIYFSIRVLKYILKDKHDMAKLGKDGKLFRLIRTYERHAWTFLVLFSIFAFLGLFRIVREILTDPGGSFTGTNEVTTYGAVIVVSFVIMESLMLAVKILNLYDYIQIGKG